MDLDTEFAGRMKSNGCTSTDMPVLPKTTGLAIGQGHTLPPKPIIRSAADKGEYLVALAALAALPPLARLMLWRTAPKMELVSEGANLGYNQARESMRRFETGQIQSIDRIDWISQELSVVWSTELTRYHERARK